jgi:hypothetical protein
VASRVWRSVGSRFAMPLRADTLPGALLEAFSGMADTAQRLVTASRLVSPIGTESARAF